MKVMYYVIEISDGIYFSGVSNDGGNSKFEVTTQINKANQWSKSRPKTCNRKGKFK